MAVKMLIGDRAKYLGIIMRLTFASLLITQQGAIFVGLMTRTYGFITDTALPDLWVMDPRYNLSMTSSRCRIRNCSVCAVWRGLSGPCRCIRA